MNRKPTIGLLTPFLGGNYLGEIINAIQKSAHEHNARLVAIRTAGKDYDGPIAMEHVDGWIILNNAVKDSYIQELAGRYGKPIVAIAKNLDQLQVQGQMVECDNEDGIIQAVVHLYEHGHRAIGFVGHMSLDDLKKRLNGYRKAMKLLKLPFNPEHLFDPGDLSVMGGRTAAQQIVDAGLPITAAVVCTDMTALGLVERFKELGHRVPEELAVIGFDNTVTAQLSDPALASIDQNIGKIGATAVELVLEHIANPKLTSQTHYIECTLAARVSCGCHNQFNAEKQSSPWADAYESQRKHTTLLGVQYEFNKFILNFKLEKIKDVSWVLAPYFHWACLGLWNEDADLEGNGNMEIDQLYHFHRHEDLPKQDSTDITNFPPYQWFPGDLAVENSEMTYMIPYRTVSNNWSVLAVGTSLANTLNKLGDYISIVHYLDLIADTLDRQALVEEVREQGAQYRQIAEQLEIVSRTSNDGIWELNIGTGELVWNQRFYDLLKTASAQSFEAMVHPDDLALYQSAYQLHMDVKKPFQLEVRLRMDSGDYVWAAISGEAVRDDEDRPVWMVGSVRDITERKLAEDNMRYMAYHDTLTGLTNRRRFYEEIATAGQFKERQFAVLVLDVDHFKKINDSFGHQMGDKLLQSVSFGLKELVKAEDHIARFGGDEFVILYHSDNVGEVEAFAQSITPHLSKRLTAEGLNIAITMSIGISIFPQDGADADTLIKKADIAMYKVKQHGKNHYAIFSPQMIEQRMWRINTENELRTAIDNGNLVLHYQPQIHLETGELFGVEALLRWERAPSEFVPPLSFISLAEETGLIIPIGEWVIAEACRQGVLWREQGEKPILISVNISGQQLKEADFVDKVEEILAATGMDPEYLCFEITESTVIDELDSTVMMLKRLADLGITISMDDFGTGYSSLSMLKKLPIDMLKIDKSFIREMTFENKDIDIVKAIISISNSFKLRIVAEGVEDKAQYELLRELGCHYIQGYYISRPLPKERIAQFVEHSRL